MPIGVRVLDANLAPIVGARLVVANTTFNAVTDGSGNLTLPLDPKMGCRIEISHPDFVTEVANFQPSLERGSWDNALVSRQQAGGGISLQVQLGRCVSAPVKISQPDAIEALAKTKGADPGGALLLPAGNFANQYVYRYQWFAESSVQLALDHLLPDQPPGPSQKGWDRFQSAPSQNMQLADRGRFFWLLYPGQPARQQFAVAIWSPNIDSEMPLAALDMIVFFSPHTASFSGQYPFGLVPGPKGGTADQPYMTLGKRYLLEEYYFAHQAAARALPAIIVMPICARGDWGPFAFPGGLLRLLKEVAIFLQRECRTSKLGVDAIGYDPAYRLAGGSLRTGRGIYVENFGATPAVGKVAVSFFSTGAAPAKQLLAGGGSAAGYPAHLWGVSDAARSWPAVFREWWDMDGFHPETGGWPNYLDLLGQSYRQDQTRVFRMCHSAGRVPPDPLKDSHLIWKGLLAGGQLYNRAFTGARELQGSTWSAVAFSDDYVEGGAANVLPPLTGDAHHNTPRVAFSHMAQLTGLGRRSMSSFQRGP